MPKIKQIFHINILLWSEFHKDSKSQLRFSKKTEFKKPNLDFSQKSNHFLTIFFENAEFGFFGNLIPDFESS